MFEFENLIVYKKAKILQQKIYHLVLNDRKIHSYIKDQIIRASVSIVINIAEGTGKKSAPSRSNFYSISRGSVFECVSLIDLIYNEKLITIKKKNELYMELEELSKMLYSLIHK